VVEVVVLHHQKQQVLVVQEFLLVVQEILQVQQVLVLAAVEDF
jgi:hypothetical protein